MKQYAKFELSQIWFEVGERICKAHVKVMISRWHNNQKDPTMIDATWPKIDDIEIDIKYITVYGDDELLGRYDGFEIPKAEMKYWENHIKAKANKHVAETDPFKYDWASDESTF